MTSMQSIMELLDGPAAGAIHGTSDASDGPLQLLEALRLMCASEAQAQDQMQPEDLLRLETYDRLRLVDRIHDINPDRLPLYQQADGPGDYLEPDRAALIDKFRIALSQRRNGARDWAIVERRFGLVSGAPETMEDIGAAFDLSRERVRQIVEQTLGFFRQVLAEAEAPRAERAIARERRRFKPVAMIECKPSLRLRCA